MTAIRGTTGVIQLGATPGTDNLAEVTSFTIDTVMDSIETSAMGNNMRTYTHGLGSYTVSADIIIEATDAATQYTDIAALQFADGTQSPVIASFVLYPEGSTAGNMKLAGSNAIVTGFSMTSSFDGIVTGSITLQGSGNIDFTAAS